MKLSAIIAILTVCLVTSCTPQISNKNIKDSSKMQNIQKEITMEQVRNRCRSMLHKVENRDDLIKQMYDTAFKDDCLYTMYASELQEIWQIPVIEAYDYMQHNQDIHSSIGMYVVFRHTELKSSLYITQTKEYLDKIGSIFPENAFPKFFPKPMTHEIPEGVYLDFEYSAKRKDDDSIKERLDYYWRESGREIIATNSGGGAILALEFCSNLKMSPMP